MYLKRLEIHGFKSFADRIDMSYESGITGVVGPNGSGKSNISDSIRWVLGEQSPKSLRGSKMEDVIFSGTANRRPLGMAEVSLTLDNSSQLLPTEYGEVTITRRVYRSGESEYYLNKSLCRLKDIRELLMDTGIGKEGYSIIGQGKIDEILNSKPEERRLIFEEAAGIIKYKTRRDESEKKLKATEENLLRVADILHELKNQLEPLRKQSQKAKQYQTLKEQLLKLEVNLFIREIDKQEGELKHLTEQLQIIQASLEEQHQWKEDNQKKLEEMKQKLAQWERDYEELLEEFHQTENQMKEQMGAISLNREKLTHNKRDQQRIEEELQHLEQLDEEANQRLESRLKELEEVCVQLEGIQALLKEEAAKHDVQMDLRATEEAALEALKAEMIDTLNGVSDKKGELNSLKTLIQTMEDRMAQIQRELKVNEERMIEKAEAVRTLEEELAALLQTMKENGEQAGQAQASLKELEQEIDQSTRSYEIVRNQYQHQTSRKNLLEELEREHDGFHKSVKNILVACRRDSQLGKGIHGVVADLIQVPKGYEVAMETGLGSAIQNIVCQTEEDGKRVIDYMKKHQLGRITLLPMSALQRRGLSNEEQTVVNQFKGVKVAFELAKVAPQFENVFSHLLGRVLIVPDLEVGIQVARKLQYRLKVVTLEGDQLNIGGSMTGGSLQKSSTGILGRKRELEELKSELVKLKDQLDAHQHEIVDKKGIYQKQEGELSRLQARGQQLKIQEVTLENRRDQGLQEKKQLKDNCDQLTREEHQLKQVQEDASRQSEEKQQEIQKMETQIESIQQQIQVAQGKITDDRRTLEALNEAITQQKVQAASVEGKKNSMLQEIQQLQLNLGQQDQNRKKKQHTLQQIEGQAQQLLAELAKYEVQLNTMKEQAASQESRLAGRREEKALLLSQESEINHALANQNKVVSDLQESLHRLDLKRTRLEMQQQTIYNRLWEEYELTYHSAQAYREEIADFSKANREIRQYREEMKALGSVNLDAIEEYEKVKDRYEFLKQQQEDLLQAKAALAEVIQEMEKHMETQFAEQFQIIRANFNQVFAKLFGGGRADLILEAEGDLLNSGIDIIAQPPGKKLQNLSLLSGGERALTAISLLFAILLVKPSPFCILDEIEAALDDANVNRFANYLKELSQSTQFIVVTHRKGTMEIADVLYGVTMEEEGVSKLVSVKLADKDKVVAS